MRRAIAILLAMFLGVSLSVLVRAYLHRAEVVERGRDSAGREPIPTRLRKRPDRGSSRGQSETSKFESAEFRVLDLYTHEPLGAIRVRLIAGTGEETRISTQAGSFALEGVFDERASIEIASEGYTAITALAIELPEDGGNLYLVPFISLLVRCLAADTHQPIPSAHVVFAVGGRAETTRVTNEAGVADLDVLVLSLDADVLRSPSPRYSMAVTAAAQGFLTREVGIFVTDPAEQWEEIQIVLEPALVLDLLVQDAATQEGVGHAEVIHQWDHETRRRVNQHEHRRVTDEDGHLTLPVHKDARGVEIIAFHPEYAPAGLLVDSLALSRVRRDNSTRGEVVLRMERGWDIEGLVLDTNGAPVPDVTVDIDPVSRDDLTDWMRAAYHKHFGRLPDVGGTDEVGTFTIAAVPAGDYRVVLVHPDYVETPDNPLLSAREDSEPWVGFLQAGLELQGQVSDQDGTPLLGVILTVIRYESTGKIKKGYSKVVDTREDGSFRVSGLVPGSYQLLFKKRGYSVATREVDPRALALPLEVSLEKADRPTADSLGSLALSFEQDGLRVYGGRVEALFHSLTKDGRSRSHRAPIEDGQAVLRQIPVGTYRIVLWVEGYGPVVLDAVTVGETREVLSVDIPRSNRVDFEIPGGVDAGRLLIEDRWSRTLLAEVPVAAVEKGEHGAVVRRRLPRGEYTATFESDSGRMYSSEFDLASVDESSVNVVLASEAPKDRDSPISNRDP